MYFGSVRIVERPNGIQNSTEHLSVGWCLVFKIFVKSLDEVLEGSVTSGARQVSDLPTLASITSGGL